MNSHVSVRYTTECAPHRERKGLGGDPTGKIMRLPNEDANKMAVVVLRPVVTVVVSARTQLTISCINQSSTRKNFSSFASTICKWLAIRRRDLAHRRRDSGIL